MVRQSHRTVSWPGWIALALLCLFVGLPLLAVALQAWWPGAFLGGGSHLSGGFSLFADFWRLPLWRDALVNSLVLGVGAAVLGTLLGGVLGFFSARYRYLGAGLTEWTAWLLLITPSFVLTEGWVLFFQPGGILAQITGLNMSSLFFSPIGLIVAEAVRGFPLAYLAVSRAATWREDSFTAAAALCGAERPTQWRTIDLPLLTPALLAGGCLIFAETVGDFGLPSTINAFYHFSTLPYAVYAAITTSPIRFDEAGMLSLVLFILIAIALWGQFAATRKASGVGFLSQTAKRAKPIPIGKWGILPSVVIIVLFALGVVLPFGITLLLSFVPGAVDGLGQQAPTLSYYANLFAAGGQFLSAAAHSLLLAVGAAVAAVVIGTLVSVVMAFTGFFGRRLLDTLSTATLAVPAIIIGIGSIFIWNQPWLAHAHLVLYGTPWLVWIDYVAVAIPLAVRLQLPAFLQIPRSWLRAAELGGAGSLRQATTIILPVAWNAVLTALLTSIAALVLELAVSTVTYPPNYSLLPVFINEAFEENLDFGTAAAGSVLAMTLVGILIALGNRLALRRSDTHAKLQPTAAKKGETTDVAS